MSHRYLDVEDAACPSPEMETRLQDQSNAEVRVCGVCGENVASGERVAVLTQDDEVWRHPYHQAA